MSDVEISREEIAKKFYLPERKTKIETILKLQGDQPVYCLCQSTDISRFMICCEKCDEWYHGDCIGLAEKDAKLIKKWYCFECIEKHGLKVVYFPHDTKKAPIKKKKQKRPEKREYSSTENRCGQCSNCLQNEECGNKEYKRFSEKPSKHPKYENKEAYFTKGSDDEEQFKKLHEERKTQGRSSLAELAPKQCMGPRCTNISRVNSKYCSDNCGLALAKLRILSLLPHRIAHNQQYPSEADKRDKEELDRIKAQKKFAFEELQRLDVKEKKLMELVERAKKVPIVETEDVIMMDDDNKLYCMCCGWQIPIRSFVRHVETCFRKFESQTAVVGLNKSNSEYCNIFCDFYDTANKTFCMRLRYICPKHYKPKKVLDNEVCGCPIIKTISSSIFSGAERFCQKSKKKCEMHPNWEILAISDIDLERHREWNKMSVLLEKEANIVKQMSNRAGALGLLLHCTQAHFSSL